MNNLLKISSVISLVLVTSGCDTSQKILTVADSISSQQKTIERQNEQIKEMQNQIDELVTKTNEMKVIQQKLELNNLFRQIESIAFLTPGDEGYSTIRFDLGSLTISLSDVKPYASGSKIDLRFGNPLATSINGVQMKVSWGKVDKDGNVISDTEKEKDVSFAKTFRSGAWTNVSVVLDGIPPSELGFVRIKEVSHTGISLSK
ncbi:DUF3251 domain-containing protein [Plesiomonas shigelloides]|uniref:DUF3251 domain-containing protein n=1 Tax=Plesiomonas shigelloides TaxID=703 RepID=UPI0028865AD7|nr:DUF3251 domain-containing protein [Plesiomonas shigelloides]MDT1012848.1 DUF3251 domain-containing protein [Plesiomonas shigelloides]